MAIQYNRISFIGNLGRDPEMRYLPSGKAVTNINVAANREWTNDEGVKTKETTWYRVSVFGPQAESVNQYKKQGDLVLVEGRLRPDENGNPRIWTADDGTPRASFEVIASRVVFLPSGGNGGSDPYAPPADNSVDEDDIPF